MNRSNRLLRKQGIRQSLVEPILHLDSIVFDMDDIPSVVPILLELIDNRLNSFFRKVRIPTHNPDVLLARNSDHCPVVISSESDHEVIEFQRPNR